MLPKKHFELFLGSLPGDLRDDQVMRQLSLQVKSFVSFELALRKKKNRPSKNKGFGFLIISDPAEYKMLLSKEKVLTIGDRTIKVSKYQPGSVSKSERLLAASRKICIKGLPGWVTDKDLRMAFQASGLFPDTIFRAQKNSTREDLPFGFAEFSSVELAEAAIKIGTISLHPKFGEGFYLTLQKYQKARSSKQRLSAQKDSSQGAESSGDNELVVDRCSGETEVRPEAASNQPRADSVRQLASAGSQTFSPPQELPGKFGVRPSRPEARAVLGSLVDAADRYNTPSLAKVPSKSTGEIGQKAAPGNNYQFRLPRSRTGDLPDFATPLGGRSPMWRIQGPSLQYLSYSWVKSSPENHEAHNLRFNIRISRGLPPGQ